MQVMLTPENEKAVKERIKKRNTFRSVAGEVNAIVALVVSGDRPARQPKATK